MAVYQKANEVLQPNQTAVAVFTHGSKFLLIHWAMVRQVIGSLSLRSWKK